MKIVEWGQSDTPVMGYLDNAHVLFNDHRQLYNLEEGDLIHQLSDDENGTYCYRVVMVEPDEDAEAGDPNDLNIVYAEAVL